MIFVRIKSRFRQRAAEWFCAANLFLFGVVLLLPHPTYETRPYEAFRWLGENWTGLIVTACGGVWLAGLIINGAMQRTSSTIRAACAALGAVIYSLIGVGFAFAPVLTTGPATYLLISVLALYSLYHIMRDKREHG